MYEPPTKIGSAKHVRSEHRFLEIVRTPCKRWDLSK